MGVCGARDNRRKSAASVSMARTAASRAGSASGVLYRVSVEGWVGGIRDDLEVGGGFIDVLGSG